MQRWHKEKSVRLEDPAVDAFLEEVIEVCKKHGMCIGHEDGHGAFLVERGDWTFEWLLNAHIGFEVG
jgi:sugar phosphate isomerase/epimerase